MTLDVSLRHYECVSNSTAISYGCNKITCDTDRVLFLLSTMRMGGVVALIPFYLFPCQCALWEELRKGAEADKQFPLLFLKKLLLSSQGIQITVFVTLIQLEQSCHLQSRLCTLYVAECSLLFPSEGGFPKSCRVAVRRTPSPKCFKSRGKVV